MGIESVPIRMPLNYEGFRDWFPRFVRETLAPLDVRNALGVGLAVSADGNSVATLTTDVTQAVVDGAIADHLADANPHPQYLTQAEGDSLYAALNTFNSLAQRYRYGMGTPEGNVTADTGTVFLRADGSGANEIVYVKTSGSGSTGWTAMSVP